MADFKPTFTAEFDDFMRRYRVLSDDSEAVFIEFIDAIATYCMKYKGAEKELVRLQEELVKVKSDNYNLHMKLKNARQLLDAEKNRRIFVEKEKFDLERQISQVVEMLGQGNLNEQTREKLQVLSNTFNGLGHRPDGGQLSLQEVLSPNHLSTINEDADTMGSIINASEIDLTDGDELEASKTRSGRSFRSSSPKNRSGQKRKSSPEKRQNSGNNKLSKNNDENKENRHSNHVFLGPPSGPFYLHSAPPLSSDETEVEGQALTAFKSTPLGIFPSSPLRHHQQLPPVPSVTTPGASNLYSSPGNSPVLRSLSNTKVNCRPHSFVSKTIYWTDYCQPCEKRIKFAKLAYKCRDCRATCHMECKDAVPLPCVPISNTPGMKGPQFSSIVDYAPPVAPMVPAIVVHCTNEVESRGLIEVGLYRVPGSDREVKELRDRFLKGRGVPNLANIDIHVICSTVKMFFRSLKEPLIPSTMWRDFMSATEKTEHQDALAVLYQAISDLPQPNRDTLAWMISHLQRVAECVECKMTVTNLARAFGPTLIGYSVADIKPHELLEETKLQQKVMEQLMAIPSDYWKAYTNVPDEAVPVNKFSSPEKNIGSSNRRRSIITITTLPPRETAKKASRW